MLSRCLLRRRATTTSGDLPRLWITRSRQPDSVVRIQPARPYATGIFCCTIVDQAYEVASETDMPLIAFDSAVLKMSVT